MSTMRLLIVAPPSGKLVACCRKAWGDSDEAEFAVATTPVEAKQRLSEESFDVVLVDLDGVDATKGSEGSE